MIKRLYSLVALSTFAYSSFVLAMLLLPILTKAQPPFFRNITYIENYSSEAVEQMLQFKIPASVILAQAILESRSGTSPLALRSNNHFGIKCHKEWIGDTIVKDDDTNNECFRKYTSIKDSYYDHSLFLFSRPRYALLFKLSVTDYIGWCYGLKSCGYATSPAYAEELIKIIEDLKLYLLDGTETLEKKSLSLCDDQHLKISPFNIRSAQLAYFASTGLLFADEHTLPPAVIAGSLASQ